MSGLLQSLLAIEIVLTLVPCVPYALMAGQAALRAKATRVESG